MWLCGGVWCVGVWCVCVCVWGCVCVCVCLCVCVCVCLCNPKLPHMCVLRTGHELRSTAGLHIVTFPQHSLHTHTHTHTFPQHSLHTHTHTHTSLQHSLGHSRMNDVER